MVNKPMFIAFDETAGGGAVLEFVVHT